ncbi:MAG: hypothetical protein PHF51_04255 [Candidatus ainarchaeum sp.]|nr:hypothetical protein [Candidatus ainarchaeum sp.]
MPSAETISTGVDGFIALVREKGRVEINEAASKLGLSRQVLEEWAQVLEEQGLIRIEYKFTKFYLIWLASTKEDAEIRRDLISEQAIVATRQAESRRAELEKLGGELEEMKRDFEKISGAFEIELGGVKSRIEALQEMKRQKGELLYMLSELRGKYDAKISGFRDSLKESDASLGAYMKRQNEILGSVRELASTIEGLKSAGAKVDVQEIEAGTPSGKEVSGMLRDASKKASVVAKEIAEADSAYSALVSTVGKAGAAVAENRRRVADFSRDAELKLSALEKVRAKSDERFAKSVSDLVRVSKEAMHFAKGFIDKKAELEAIHARYSEMERGFGSLEARVGEIAAKKAEVERLGKQLGEYSSSISEMLEHRGDIEKLSAQVASTRKAFDALGSEMKDFSAKREQVSVVRAQLDSLGRDFVKSGEEFDARMRALEAGMAEFEAIQAQRAGLAKESVQQAADISAKRKEVEAALKEANRLLGEAEAGAGELASRVKKAEPRLAEMRAARKALEDANVIAAKKLGTLGNVESSAATVGERIEALEAQEAALHSDVKKFGERLKKTASALGDVRQEFDSKAADLDRAIGSTDEELKRLTSELGVGAERADGLVKTFEQRISRIKAVESQLASLQSQREELSNELSSLIRGLEALEAPKRTMPLAELSRRLAETKKKLAQANEKMGAQQRDTAAAKAALRDILESKESKK